MKNLTMSWTGDERGSCTIECSAQSPWSTILGADPHPVRGSIDRLDQALPQAPVETITLSGAPESCLLPILWARTIWPATQHASVVIAWDAPPQPTQQRATPLAARLTCLLADRVLCPHPELAQSAYGFDPQEPGISEDAMDLLAGIVDLWDPGLRSAVLGDDWTTAMRKGLEQCALDGHARVGIYGAGTHTRGVGAALMDPPVEVACIIDDDPRRAGERMWGFEIITPDKALEAGIDAVVLSANSIEKLLWERSERFRDAGVSTYRLYD